MTARSRQYDAVVRRREQLSPHLVRLGLEVPGFESTGIPDEWVGLVVPGQFQVRYYTVRSCRGDDVVLDVVVHDKGLVTEWVGQDVTGQRVTLHEAKGSFDVPPGSEWLLLVGDLTALPAMARIVEAVDVPTRVWAEVPDTELGSGYLPDSTEVTWLAPPLDADSRLAETVEGLDWPAGDGYFWMAGESAQMRAIRKHFMRERRLPSSAYNIMGYWRASTTAPRPVRLGQDWAAYDEAGG